jgi:hypothetical protein
MTRNTNAKIAGYAFIYYIAAGILTMILSAKTRSGTGIVGKLAGMAQHVTQVRITYLVGLSLAFAAFALGISLYALTRDEDADLAMTGLVCRVAEGIVGVALPSTLVLLWLATGTGPSGVDPATSHALATYLVKLEGVTSLISAMLFAVGSTAFCWLLLRGRMIPVPLAWIGVGASVLLVVGLPFQLAGFVTSPFFQMIWVPMAIFELTVAPWMIIKGVAEPVRSRAT